MAYCSKCGTQLAEGADFCANCGQPAGSAPPPSAVPETDVRIAENVAGLLCYVLGWVTGLVFLLIDRRPFVRFHAAQSIVVFGGLQILYVVLGIGGGGIWIAGGIVGLLRGAIAVVEIVLWIVLMVKAHKGERYRVPFAADMADRLAAR